MIYYYYHAESDCLWASNRDFEEEGNPDGCTEPVDDKRMIQLMRELKENSIIYYEHIKGEEKAIEKNIILEFGRLRLIG